MLRCWSDYPGYADFVRERWLSFDIFGWGGYVLKCKLKLMKASLKEWHQNHSQNLDGQLLEVKNCIEHLDAKAKGTVLLEAEMEELHDLSVNMHSLARAQNSISWQKSRSHWIKEGDANTKNFHGHMSTRRRQNSINVVYVDGVSVDGVKSIRGEVYHHFSTNFKSFREERPRLDGSSFRKLSNIQAGNLTRPFSLEEV